MDADNAPYQVGVGGEKAVFAAISEMSSTLDCNSLGGIITDEN